MATAREQLNTAVLRAWVDDDAALTLRLCGRLAEEFPRDLAIVLFLSRIVRPDNNADSASLAPSTCR